MVRLYKARLSVCMYVDIVIDIPQWLILSETTRKWYLFILGDHVLWNLNARVRKSWTVPASSSGIDQQTLILTLNLLHTWLSDQKSCYTYTHA